MKYTTILYAVLFAAMAVLAVIGWMNYTLETTKEPFGSGSPIGCPNDYALCDYYMASSALSVYGGNTAYAYIKADTIKATIKEKGARLVDLNIYNVKDKPVVGYASKNLAMYSYNTIPFEECCLAIANSAFADDTPGGKNPFVLSLMFHTTDSNIITACADILKSTLVRFMLGKEYSSSNRDPIDLAIEPVCNLMGKIIIVSGPETEGTQISELVNMVWGKSSLRRMTYKQASQTYTPEEDTEYNTRKITLVVPDDNMTDLKNKKAEICFIRGCQWVAMNYGSIDTALDLYAGKFKESPFALKPEPLRHKVVMEKEVVPQDPALALGTKTTETRMGTITIGPVHSSTLRTHNK
jgi:hypothetical protein